MSKTAVFVINIVIIIYEGQMLSAYEKPFFNGTRYGPFVGPFAIKKVRPKNGWESLRLTEVDFSSAKVVIFCSEEKMTGVCNQILPPTRVDQVMVGSSFFIHIWDKALYTYYQLHRVIII